MSLQISAGLAASACRVGEAAPGQRRPSSPTASPTTCISALAVSCGRWLRNASSRSCVTAIDHRPAVAPSARTNAGRRSTRRPRRRRSGVSSHGRPLEQIGRACSRPPRGGARQRMPADEREARRQRPRGLDDRALGAAGVGDQRRPGRSRRSCASSARFCAHRRRQHDQVGLGQHDRGRRADVDRVRAAAPPRARRCDRRRSTAASGNDAAHGKRDRPADQAEADDADAPKVAAQ